MVKIVQALAQSDPEDAAGLEKFVNSNAVKRQQPTSTAVASAMSLSMVQGLPQPTGTDASLANMAAATGNLATTAATGTGTGTGAMPMATGNMAGIWANSTMSGNNTAASNDTLANRQLALRADAAPSPTMYRFVVRQASNETEARPSEGVARPTGAAMATEGLLLAGAAQALETAAAQVFGAFEEGERLESDGKRERLIRRIGSLEEALF
ncbi:hypothetical protein LTS18_005905 [Coniosporium uncinatum]|uniref:Uncharacterized protein n=1 Tax=Coniosporium uncinatum TaxID=93489 RepID=A0ACC3D4E4_9PEZI|nr:hypothetical protein LTS18_005905 [Coniosporium uncinatum]